MSFVRTLMIGFLLAAAATSQTIIATNLGGGCGATQGYPSLGNGGRLMFYVQRPICSTNGWMWPTGVILDLQPPQHSLPFVPGIAPGCVIIEPTYYLPTGPVGGAGSTRFVLDLTQIPIPLTIYIQGVAACFSGSVPAEIAFSDAWELQIQ